MDQNTERLAGTFLEGVTSFNMASKATGITYRILVSVPNTKDTALRFPLLVVLDGCMDFGTAVETARIQGMTGTAKDLIVVGVSTAGTLAQHNLRRLRDYTPAGMRPDDPAWTGYAIGQILTARFEAAGLRLDQAIGGAAAFQTFLSDELLPELVTKYPVDPDDLGVAGHSAGGTFVSHALLTGSPFHKLIMGSFSLEMYGETLAQLEAEFSARALLPARQVFAAVGGAEIDEPLVSSSMRAAQEMLARLQKSCPECLQLTLHTFPGETHGSTMAHLLASGIRVLWPSGKTYMQALPARMRG